MLQLFLIFIIVAAAIFLIDWLSRRGLIGKEVTRKLTHIIIGVTFAFLPFFIGLNLVALLAFADIFIVLLARRYKWFENSRAVGRRTWGEFFFLAGTIVSAIIANSNWIFATGILILALADAAAALVGRAFGRHEFEVFGQKKSLEGTVAFMVVAFIVLTTIVFVIPSGISISWPLIILLSISAALLEAGTPYGVDNFLLPIYVIMILNLV